MSLKLIANYSKRLGLPGYSSHQFSVCVESEINSIDDVKSESARLYDTLQASVDEEIQRTGFTPTEAYGKNATNGSHSTNGNTAGNEHGQWTCSDKQRDLILKIVDENSIDKTEIESLAQERFGKGVKQLNKLEASGLIDELLERYGDKAARTAAPRNGTRRPYARGGAR